MEIRYHDKRVRDFVAFLDFVTGPKVNRALDLLEENGHRLGMPFSRSLGAGLCELRIRGFKEIRLFFVFHEDEAVILHGYIKQSRRTPKHELNVARRKQKELDHV